MRYLYRLAALTGLLLAPTLRAQPANDNCANAVAVGTGVYSVDTTAATSEGVPTGCFDASSLDVWYDYVAPASGIVQVYSNPNTLQVSALSGCGGSLIGCTAGGNALTGKLAIKVESGQHVLFRVSSTTARIGTLTIDAPVSPMPNDECASAFDITGQTFLLVSNTLATKSSDAPPSCAPMARDVWFRYTAPITGNIVFSTCGRPASGTFTVDTVMSAYNSCGSTELACGDDGACSATSTKSIITVPMVAGQQVLLRIGSKLNASGNSQAGDAIWLTIGPPVNDACAHALPITSGAPVSFDNLILASLEGSPSCSGYPNDIYYKYAAPQSGRIMLRACFAPSSNGFNLSVRNGGCGGTELACLTGFPDGFNLPSCYGGDGIVMEWLGDVTAGQQLIIRVSGPTGGEFNNQSNAGTLEISDLLTVPPNETCQGAMPITIDSPQTSADVEFDTTNAMSRAVPSACSNLGEAFPAAWYSYTAPSSTSDKIEFWLSSAYMTPYRSFSPFMTFLDGDCNGSSLEWNGNDRTPVRCGAMVFGTTPDVEDQYAHTFLRYLNANETLRFSAITFKEGSTNVSAAWGKGRFVVHANPVNVWFEDAHGSGDAGDTPAQSQIIQRTGNHVDRVVGSVGGSTASTDRADVYKIRICDLASFSASTENRRVGTSTTSGGSGDGTGLALFDEAGHPVAMSLWAQPYAQPSGSTAFILGCSITNETSLIPSEGIYYLAIFRTSRPTWNGQPIWNDVTLPFYGPYPPNGPGGAPEAVLNGWTEPGSNEAFYPTNYRIALTGACFIEPAQSTCCRGTTCTQVPAGSCTGQVAGSNSVTVASCGTGNALATCCYADFNHDGTESIDDLFLYINAYFTSSPWANYGGDGVAQPTIDDLFLYINAYFTGCQ